MKLPNAHLAQVDKEKITDYLLNPAHPANGGKANFFLGFGFKRSDWRTLAIAFLELAVKTEILKITVSSHGDKYVLDGRIDTPSGKRPSVRTIWIIDQGLSKPRLVTAYPNQEEDQHD